jgi:hypothetical protein
MRNKALEISRRRRHDNGTLSLLLTQCQAILFAREYAHLSHTDKDRLQRSLFAADPRYRLWFGPGTNSAEVIDGPQKDSFAKYKKEFAKITGARNRTLEAYRMVGTQSSHIVVCALTTSF